jgi:hypothetical protein
MRSFVQALVLFITMSACALDPGKDPAAVESGDPAPASSQDETAADPLSAAAIAPRTSGCAHVKFCDASGSTGTVCVQDGCTLSQAKSECEFSDLPAIGCSFHCPGQIEKLGGGISPMCCPGVCSPGCPC